jgi:hypothetical protein
MTITNDSASYGRSKSEYTDGPLFSSLDITGGIVAAAMLLLPLTAAGTHYSHQGWDTVQTEKT